MIWLGPRTLEEALEQRRDYPNSVPVAGGTDFLVRYFDILSSIPVMIGLDFIEELRGIVIGEVVRIGARTTHQEIAEYSWFHRELPMLAQTAASVGSPQIKHRGTVGGNIGNASPAADMVPPLIVLGATVELGGYNRTRSMSLEDFFLGPGITALADNELILALEFPAPRNGEGSCFVKLGKRKAMSISIASVAVAVRLHPSSGNVESVRICYGSLGPTPIRANQAEALLETQGLAGLLEAQEIVQKEISPIDDIRGTAEYRRQVAAQITAQAVTEAFALAQESCDE